MLYIYFYFFHWANVQFKKKSDVFFLDDFITENVYLCILNSGLLEYKGSTRTTGHFKVLKSTGFIEFG